jgi:hypothetical protein
MDDMVSTQNFRSESLMRPTEDFHTKVPLESLTPGQIELRKKQFQEDHADWLALQNKHFEEHGLWCDGLVPWMNEGFGDLRAD